MPAEEVVPLPPNRSPRRRSDPSRFAANQRLAFTGMNLHVGKSSIVHAVAWIDWIDDLVLPAPACRQGFAGHGAHGELRATHWLVTCRRCRRLHGETSDKANETAVQGTLFPLDGSGPEVRT